MFLTEYYHSHQEEHAVADVNCLFVSYEAAAAGEDSGDQLVVEGLGVNCGPL